MGMGMRMRMGMRMGFDYLYAVGCIGFYSYRQALVLLA
jgi:hypothetical protein